MNARVPSSLRWTMSSLPCGRSNGSAASITFAVQRSCAARSSASLDKFPWKNNNNNRCCRRLTAPGTAIVVPHTADAVRFFEADCLQPLPGKMVQGVNAPEPCPDHDDVTFFKWMHCSSVRIVARPDCAFGLVQQMHYQGQNRCRERITAACQWLGQQRQVCASASVGI